MPPPGRRTPSVACLTLLFLLPSAVGGCRAGDGGRETLESVPAMGEEGVAVLQAGRILDGLGAKGGRAQYRMSRSRPARSEASIRTLASRLNPPP